MNRKVFFSLIVAMLTAPGNTCRADPTTLAGITNEYRFDDGIGTETVDSVGGNNAVLHNFGAGNAQWVPGAFGGGINFTNENAYVVTNSPISAASENQFSISFWARLNSKPNSNDSVLASPLPDNLITYNPTGNTNSLGKKGIGIGSVRDPSEPLIGVWENYVITYDRPSSIVSVYRNGVLRDTGDVTFPALNSRWIFGHNQDPGNTNGSWHGALDEIQFYNRVLTVNEIQMLVSNSTPQGDYNRDGRVDTADYVVWRNQLGQIVPACTGADADCNTFVEVGEYDVWKRSYGRSAMASATIVNIPEPTSLLLFAIGWLLIPIGEATKR